jgi:hypothetical protein
MAGGIKRQNAATLSKMRYDKGVTSYLEVVETLQGCWWMLALQKGGEL